MKFAPPGKRATSNWRSRMRPAHRGPWTRTGCRRNAVARPAGEPADRSQDRPARALGFRRWAPRCAMTSRRENYRGSPGSGPLQLPQSDAEHGLAKALGEGAGRGHGPHRAPEDERYAHRSLVGGGVGTDHATRLAIEHQRRVDVDVAEDDAILIDELRPKQHAAHVDRIARARGGGDRAHEGLVRVAHVRIHHVEMPFVDRHIHWLADRAARVMEPRRQVARALRSSRNPRGCRSGVHAPDR